MCCQKLLNYRKKNKFKILNYTIKYFLFSFCYQMDPTDDVDVI